MPPSDKKSSKKDENETELSKHSRSETKAGLNFPVGRLNRYLKERNNVRLSKKAGVYLAGVLEYVTADLLDRASQVTSDDGKSFMKPVHVNTAVRDDPDFSLLLGGVQIIGGGIRLPLNSLDTHAETLAAKRKSKKVEKKKKPKTSEEKETKKTK